MIFGTNLCTLNIGLMMYGRAWWQEAEKTRKDFNTVLIRQDKKFFTFELSKVIQDAIPLILHCMTTYWFRIISSSRFITSDVQSTCIPSQIQDCENALNGTRTVVSVFGFFRVWYFQPARTEIHMSVVFWRKSKTIWHGRWKWPGMGRCPNLVRETNGHRDPSSLPTLLERQSRPKSGNDVEIWDSEWGRELQSLGESGHQNHKCFSRGLCSTTTDSVSWLSSGGQRDADYNSRTFKSMCDDLVAKQCGPGELSLVTGLVKTLRNSCGMMFLNWSVSSQSQMEQSVEPGTRIPGKPVALSAAVQELPPVQIGKSAIFPLAGLRAFLNSFVILGYQVYMSNSKLNWRHMQDFMILFIAVSGFLKFKSANGV